ncbi:MAG TPA: hypothetical protein VN157_16390 [Caulobacter sp.]|nr:hypothetical protein [Caulobacter sp.]
MRIDTGLAGSASQAPQQTDSTTLAVGTFQSSGRLDAGSLRLAPREDIARAMAVLSPAEQGALERALGDSGLGRLVDGGLATAIDVVDVAADPLVETPSERSAEAMQGDVEARWLADLRGQAELDAALSPFARLDRPAAALAATTSVRTIADLEL